MGAMRILIGHRGEACWEGGVGFTWPEAGSRRAALVPARKAISGRCDNPSNHSNRLHCNTGKPGLILVSGRASCGVIKLAF